MASDTAHWLEGLGLGKYAAAFAENEITVAALPHLTEDDLKGIGVSLGARRILLAAIAELADGTAAPETPDGAGGPVAKGAKDEVAAARSGPERRQLSILFCALVGSTALSQRLDPEDLRDVMRQYQDAVAAAVGRYDGHVAKFLGDGVLAYFGWPRAHEDQAARAVHAALDAVAAVAELTVVGTSASSAASAAATDGDGDGERLAARAGIATGQVVIGDIVGDVAGEQDAVVGETPNLAARLQALAAPGSVVIGPTTRRLTGGAFEVAAEGAHRLKGFAEPVRAWRVVGTGGAEGRFAAAHGGAALSGFVGRADEIALLTARWAQAKGGAGQAVLLSGEAGIGKSRILQEFRERLAGERHACLRYHCSPYQVNAAFHPIVEQLQQDAGFRREDTAEAKLDKLERLLAAAPGRDAGAATEGAEQTEQTEEREESAEADQTAAALLAGLLALPTDRYAPLDMTPQRRKLETVALLADRLAALAAAGPVLVLVEDVHWIDASTLEAVDAMVRRARDAAVLIVMTHRPEFAPPWSAGGHVAHRALHRLGRDDGRALAERVTGGKTLPAPVLAQILEQTDGVPLFVEELTKTVLEAGFLKETADGYALDGKLPALAIPATLKDSLMARLDRLAPVKQVVQAAACIGRAFRPDLLAAVVTHDRAAVDDALDQLVDAQLVFREATAEGTRYLFKHALVQDAAYESLLKRSRQQLHAKLAAAIEAAAAESGGAADPLELGRHHAAAGMADRAAESYLAAGQALLASSALPEASGALELGLEQAAALAPSDRRDGLQLDLSAALGTARMARLGWPHPSVAEALEPAFQLAGKLGDRRHLGPILWGLWVHYQTRTDFPRGHDWLAELDKAVGTAGLPADGGRPEAAERPEIPADGDDPESSEASELSIVRDMSAGCQYFWEAQYDRAARYTDHVRATYDEARFARVVAFTNHDPLCFSLHWAGSFRDWIVGYPDRSLERMEDAVAIARRLGHPFNFAFALTAGAHALLLCGRRAQMLAHCEEVEAVVAAEGLGPFAQNVLVGQWRGMAQILGGAHAAGYDLMRHGNDFWNGADGRVCNALFWSWMARAQAGLGETAAALALIDRAIAHCRETGDRYMEPECLRLRGELLLDGGGGGGGDADGNGKAADAEAVEAAEAALREAVDLARAHKAKSWELRAATSLARLCQATDRTSDARAVLVPVYDWFTEGFDTPDLKDAKAVLEAVS